MFLFYRQSFLIYILLYFFAVTSKLSLFVLLTRLCYFSFFPFHDGWQFYTLWLGILVFSLIFLFVNPTLLYLLNHKAIFLFAVV